MFIHKFSNGVLMFFFFFNDTATTEIYTLSLHDALPICLRPRPIGRRTSWNSGDLRPVGVDQKRRGSHVPAREMRSEEHTSELQSRLHIVCRLLLEKKKLYGSNYCLLYSNS